MLDNKEGDDKIIAVAADDVSVNDINRMEELPPYFHLELKQFFEDYKKLEKKEVLVEGFQDAKMAKTIIQKAIHDYRDAGYGSAKK